MVRPVSIDRAVSQLHRWLFVSERAARVIAHRLLSILAAVFLVSWLTMTSFVAAASAIEANVSNDSFSALSNFVRSIDAPRKSTGAPDQNSDNTAPNESTDATIVALREFSRQIEPNQTKSAADLPKLADADNLLDFLRQRGSPRSLLRRLKDHQRQWAGRRRDETNRAR